MTRWWPIGQGESLMPVMAMVSHGAAMLAFIGMGLLLILHWRGDVRGGLLIIAALLTAVWAAGWVWQAGQPLPAGGLALLEYLRTMAWLGFITVLLQPLRTDVRWVQILAGLVALTAIGGLALVGAGYSGTGPALVMGTETIEPAFALVALMMAVLGLVLLEQLLRNARPESRPATQFLCIGAGLIFGFDVYLYSSTLLHQAVPDASLDARGIVNALAVPPVLIAARRSSDWEVPVFISRTAAFHTVAMTLVGGYLLLLAAGAYYVRDFGGSWGRFGQIVMLVIGLVLLVLLIGSIRTRRKLWVLINKHFFMRKYDYREEWLRLTERLAGEPERQTHYERAIEAMADAVDSPGGLLWRRDDGQFALSGRWRVDPPADSDLSADSSIVAFLQARQWIIDFDEWRLAPERYHDLTMPAVMSELPSAWAVIPLLDQQTLTGLILLTRPRTGGIIGWEDRDVLQTLGRQIAAYLGQHENARALAQARQFDAFNQLSAFLMHDLKNLIAQQSLILKNAERHKRNPQFVDDAFETIGDSVARMERILESMQRGRARDSSERVFVDAQLETIAERLGRTEPMPRLHLNADSVMIETDREAFAMVISHLLQNACDATAPDGSVQLASDSRNGWVEICVSDTGTGMSEAFIRDELFEPFQTTKRSKGMGIGAYQARAFARRHGGQLAVSSHPGAGSVFRMTLPVRKCREF